MRGVELGRTSVRTSVVGFPVGPLVRGEPPAYPRIEAVRLLRRAVELGVRYVDVSDVDGEGRGETLVREALEDVEDVVVATTVGYDLYSPESAARLAECPLDWTPAYVRYALERSLERLGRDRVDVYAVHHLHPEALRSDDLFDVLDELRRDGRIGNVGVRLRHGAPDEVAVAALRERGLDVVRTVGAPSAELAATAAATGAALVVRQAGGESLTSLLADAAVAVVLPDVAGEADLAAITRATGEPAT